MRFEFGALPWEVLGRRPVMVTLTYPGDWEVWVPDARTFVRHREALKERWRRKYGTPIGVWVAEFQRRGAPHLHLYVGLPESVSEEEYTGLRLRTMRRRRAERDVGPYRARRRMRAPEGDFSMWLRTAWWEIVGSELNVHHGRGVDIAAAFFSDQAETTTNRVRVAEYFWRESGKWAQKQPPPDFGSLKFYGRWGQKEGFRPDVTEAEVDERTGLELRRMLRRMMVGKMREAALRTGRPMPKYAGRSRGKDGLTVFGVDGKECGPRLLRCAGEVAFQKAALAELRGEPRLPWARSRVPQRPSAPIAPDGYLPPDDEAETAAAWGSMAEEAIERHLWLIGKSEPALEESIARFEEEQADERRRRALRDAARRKAARTKRGAGGARRRPSGR